MFREPMSLKGIYNLYFSPKRKFVRKLRNILGFAPSNLRLYEMAFRHKSVAVNLKNGTKSSNERLEFLGDAILDSVVSDLIFKLYPYKDEGFLTELRSKIVSRKSLISLSKKMGLNQFVVYDTKNIRAVNMQTNIWGDAFEALIGAVYLDKGYRCCQKFLLDMIIEPHIDLQKLEQTETNFKSRLIEWSQVSLAEVEYRILDKETGNNLYHIGVYVDGELQGKGVDYNKKVAEQLASEQACSALSILEEHDSN